MNSLNSSSHTDHARKQLRLPVYSEQTHNAWAEEAIQLARRLTARVPDPSKSSTTLRTVNALAFLTQNYDIKPCKAHDSLTSIVSQDSIVKQEKLAVLTGQTGPALTNEKLIDQQRKAIRDLNSQQAEWAKEADELTKVANEAVQNNETDTVHRTLSAFLKQKIEDADLKIEGHKMEIEALELLIQGKAGPSPYDEGDLEKGESWVIDQQLAVLINTKFADFFLNGEQETEIEYQLRLTFYNILLESVRHLNYHKNLFNGDVRGLWARIYKQHTPYSRETESEINARLRNLKKTQAIGYVDYQNTMDECYQELEAIKREPDDRAKISDIIISLVGDTRYAEALRDIKKGSRCSSFKYADCRKILYAHARDIKDLATKGPQRARQRVSGFAAEVPTELTSQTRTYCHNHIRGKCTFEGCKHDHLPREAIDAVIKVLKIGNYCKQFLRGKCTFKECRYQHLPEHVIKALRELDSGPPPKHPQAQAHVAVAATQPPSTEPCGQMAAYGQCQYAEECRFAHSAEISPQDLASLLQEAGDRPTIPYVDDLLIPDEKLHTCSPGNKRIFRPTGGGAQNTPVANIFPINGQYHWDEMDCPDLISGSDSDSNYETDTADDPQSDPSDDGEDTPRAVQQLDLAAMTRSFLTTRSKSREGEMRAQLDIAAAFHHVPVPDIKRYAEAFYNAPVPDTSSNGWRWDETHEFYTNFPLNWEVHR
jgi:hypothetical protein